MAITNGYLTLAELKSYLSIGDTADDDELERAIESASRLIDRHCDRVFYNVGSTTFYYTSRDPKTLLLTGHPSKVDVQSVTAVAVDTTGDGTFDQSWTEDTHYYLSPRDKPDGVYWKLRVVRTGGRLWPTGAERIKVTGTFGWASIPAPVKNACAIQAAKIFQVAKDGGGGYSSFASGGEGLGGFSSGGQVQSKFMERGAQYELSPYVHPVNSLRVA